MRTADKVIITTAITGSVNIPSRSPYLPLSADDVATGDLVVPIAARYPIEQIREAVELQAWRHVRGKVVVTR